MIFDIRVGAHLSLDLPINSSILVARTHLVTSILPLSKARALFLLRRSIRFPFLRNSAIAKIRWILQTLQFLSTLSFYAYNNQIVVKGSPPFPLSKFVEVIGIADTDKSIRADVWTNFGDSFDTSTFNKLCQLANGEFKPLFI
ncbi:Replication protein A 14 kDa subunit B, partial [Cucurbita argyrosperma subsp. sororia]